MYTDQQIQNLEIKLLALRKLVNDSLEQVRECKSPAPARKRKKRITEEEALADLTARVISGKVKKK